MYYRTLLTVLTILLILGLGLGGCAPEGVTPDSPETPVIPSSKPEAGGEKPATSVPLPQQPTPSKQSPAPTSTPTPTPPHPGNPFVTEEEGLLFQDDFEDGNASGWALETGWDLSTDDGNYVLAGSAHSFARPDVSGWTDYTIEARFKLVRGSFHFNLRANYTQVGLIRYFLGVHTGGLYLNKQITSDFFDLSQCNLSLKLNQWHSIRAVVDGNNIKVYLDDALKINYTDSDIPILSGTSSFETLDNTIAHFDDVSVTGTRTVQRASWVKTGGPSG